MARKFARKTNETAKRWLVFNQKTAEKVQLALILFFVFFTLQYYFWRRIGGWMHYYIQYWKAARGTATLSEKCEFILKEPNFWQRTKYNRDWWRRMTCEGDRDGKIARDLTFYGILGAGAYSASKAGKKKWNSRKDVLDSLAYETYNTPKVTWGFTKWLLNVIVSRTWGLFTGVFNSVWYLLWKIWHRRGVRLERELKASALEVVSGWFSVTSFFSTLVIWKGISYFAGSEGHRRHFANKSESLKTTRFRYLSCVVALCVAVDLLRVLDIEHWTTLITPWTWTLSSILTFIGYNLSKYVEGAQYLSLDQWFTVTKQVAFGLAWFVIRYYSTASLLLATRVWGGELWTGVKPIAADFFKSIENYIVWAYDEYHEVFSNIPIISRFTLPESAKGPLLAISNTIWRALIDTPKKVINILKNPKFEFESIPWRGAAASLKDAFFIGSFPIIWYVFIWRLASKLEYGYRVPTYAFAIIPLFNSIYYMPGHIDKSREQRTTIINIVSHPETDFLPRALIATFTWSVLLYFAETPLVQELLWRKLQWALPFDSIKELIYGVIEIFALIDWHPTVAWTVVMIVLRLTHRWAWVLKTFGLNSDGEEQPAPAPAPAPGAGRLDLNDENDFVNNRGEHFGDDQAPNDNDGIVENIDPATGLEDDFVVYLDSLPEGHASFAEELAETGRRLVPRPLTGPGSQETHGPWDWILEEQYEQLTSRPPPEDVNPRRWNTPPAPPYPPPTATDMHGNELPRRSPGTAERLRLQNEALDRRNPNRRAPPAPRPESNLRAQVRAAMEAQEAQRPPPPAPPNAPNPPPAGRRRSGEEEGVQPLQALFAQRHPRRRHRA